MYTNKSTRRTMKKSVLRAACLLFSVVIVFSSCRKKEESCWECFNKPKADCKGNGKCKWDPQITIDHTRSNSSTAAYQVNDNGKCMCEQDQVNTAEKNAVSTGSMPFYAFTNVSAIATDGNNNVWVTHDQTTEYFNGSSWTTNNIAPSDNTGQHVAPYSPVNTAAKGYSISSGNYLFAATSAFGLASLLANPESNTWSYYQTINTSI